MAIYGADPGAGVTRNGAFLDPAQDWTVCGWVQYATQPLGPIAAAQVFRLRGDDLGTPFIGIFQDGFQSDGFLETYVQVFIDPDSTYIPDPILPDRPPVATWAHIAARYKASTTELTLLVNGAQSGAAGVVDLSGVAAQALETAGTDAVPGSGGVALTQLRDWQAWVSEAELALELASATAVRTANLLADTELETKDDLTDSSGNGRDWTALGSLVTVAGPAVPPNCSCATATAIDLGSLPFVSTLDTRLAPATTQDSLCQANGFNAVWYALTNSTAADKALIATTAKQSDGGYDAVMGLFAGTCAGLVFRQCNDDYDLVGVNLDGGAGIEFGIRAGETLYLLVTSLAAGGGLLTLTVSELTHSTATRVLTVGTMVGNWLGEATTADPALLAFTPIGARVQEIPCANQEGSPTEDPEGTQALAGHSSGRYLYACGRSGSTAHVYVHTRDYGFIRQLDLADAAQLGRIADSDDRLYVPNVPAVNTPPFVRRYDSDGTLETTFAAMDASTVGEVAACRGLALTADESTLFYAFGGGSAAGLVLGQYVRRFDLAGDAPLAPLINLGTGGYVYNLAIDPTTDDVFVVTVVSGVRSVARYTSAGAFVQSYASITAAEVSAIIVDPTGGSFWALGGDETIRQYSIGAGAELQAFASTGTDGLLVIANQTPGTSTTYPLRRVRRFLLPYGNHLRLFLQRLEFLVQAGVGLTGDQGVDPVFFVRLSRDGGKTYGPQYTLSPGKLGDYEHRAMLNKLGHYRNGVCEISATDPVFWAFLDCYATVESSTI